MAIELPNEVAQFLDFIGIPWINVNEDKVREFAAELRSFGANVSDAHEDATSTLTQLGSSYSGAAYEALTTMWGEKSTTQVKILTDGCAELAAALDAGADVIEAEKTACIAELVAMAAAFVADQAAAVATLGLSEAALPLIEEGARKLVEFAEQQLEQYIIGQIVEAALKPLTAQIEELVENLVIEGGGEGGGEGGAGAQYQVDLGRLTEQAAVMSTHAQTVSTHVATFSSNVQALDFSS